MSPTPPPPDAPTLALDRIEARLARMEAMMTPLAILVAHLPQTAAVATDAFDAWAEQDGQLDARLAQLTHLALRVSQPKTLQKLTTVIDHVEAMPEVLATGMDIVDAWAQTDGQLDRRLRGLMELLLQVSEPETLAVLATALTQLKSMPDLVATAVDVLDEASGPMELPARLGALAQLLERASRPKTVKQAGLLLEKLEALPEIVATALDALDDWAAIQGESGLNLEQVLAAGRDALKGLANLATAPQVRDLLDSGLLSPAALETLGGVARAMAQARTEATPSVGVFGALSAMRDPDVQRALGFVVTLGRAFGQQVDGARPPPQLSPPLK